MTTEHWKLEKDLCRCCHSEGTFNNLAEPYQVSEGHEEVYSDMLKDSLNIDITPVPGVLCTMTYTICTACILRLKEASNFKKQVLDCEQRFRDMYNRNFIEVYDPKMDADVKVEVEHYEDDFKLEMSPLGGDMIPYKLETDDEEDLEEEKKSKSKKSKGKSKAKKSKKGGSSKNETADETKDEPAKTKKGNQGYYSVLHNRYSCNLCERQFTSQPLVSQHYRFVHLKRRPRDRKCPKCDTRIPGYLRAYHLEEAHGIPAPTCGVCGKKFRFPCHVLQHQKKIHMGEKSVSCEICSKGFFNKLSLRLHMSTHSDVKRFKCDVCAREFRWENNLKDHLRIHAGDLRHVCKVCGKGFVQKSTLKQHAARNHPGVVVV